MNYPILRRIYWFSSSDPDDFVESVPSRQSRPNIHVLHHGRCVLHAYAYGCEWMSTPGFDRLAENGILFENAYTPNAKCAPSRSSILTESNSWQLEKAANHIVNFPAKFKTFPESSPGKWLPNRADGQRMGPGDPGQIDGENHGC